jgi:hypothetical protein
MIRDVMVWLDGGISDEVRLAAVAEIARRLESKVIIGLFLNPLPCCRPQGSSLASAEHGEYRIRRGHKHARVWRSWSVSQH